MVEKWKDKGYRHVRPPDGTGVSAWRRPGGWILMVATVILHFIVREQPLFWDTVQLAGKHATFYFDTDFQRLLLPETLDSGHPPTFGFYLAASWKIFGRSLTVSHWAMLPWTILWLLGAWRTVSYWVPETWVFPLVILLFIDPVWLGQAVLVSPDILVMTGFWWTMAGLQERRAAWLIPAACLLALTSTRGMMLTAALYGVGVVWTLIDGRFSIRGSMRLLLPFLPAALLGAGFLAWHYNQTGWIGYHVASPWAPSFERVGWGGFAKNIGVLGWRIFDYGRIVAVLVLVIGILRRLRDYKRHTAASRRRFLQWSTALAVLFVFLLPSFLSYRGLSGHRYLLPILQWLLIGTGLVITPLKNSHLKNILYGLVLVGLLAGHRLIYPARISQQWDATLASQPYQHLRMQAFTFLDTERIPYDSVGTVFPEIGPRDLRELNGERGGLSDLREKRTPYIWYSNVMNDFSDPELEELFNYPATARWNSWGIELVLYRRPPTKSIFDAH